MARVQSNWLLVRDEMHFMPALSEFNSKFSAHDAASAVSGVTRDSYFHSAGPRSARLDSKAAVNDSLFNDSLFFQVSVRDKFYATSAERLSGFFRSERLQFYLARFQQSRARSPKVVITVSRMADQFPCSFRQSMKDSSQDFLVQLSGHRDAERSIGREHFLF